MLKACVVDDEFHSRQTLVDMLEEFCPDIEVIGTGQNAKEAKKLIEELEPDILFLDIQMPGKTGIALMDEIDTTKCSIIFTTAFNQYVLPALRTGAVDYLEKPIDIEELIAATKRVSKKSIVPISETHYADKLVIPLQESTRIININDIVYFESTEGYTYIHTVQDQKLLSSRNIKWFEEKVDPKDFFRTHKSFLVNWKNHVTEILKHGGSSLLLSNNAEVPVSRRKLVELNIRLAQWS